MAAVVGTKTVKCFDNERQLVRVTYDFAKDGGAVGQLDLFTADEACLVKLAEMHVKTTCTSGGAATVSVGKPADLAGQVAATAVASLTSGAAILGAALDASHELAAGGKVQMDIAVAALTAGKIEYVFEIIML
jgi:hypothetical protein